MTAGEYLRMLQERRRLHLQRLAELAGSQKDVAKQARMDQSQFSNILSGRLPFTEYRARRVEQFLGLRYGLLDLGNLDSECIDMTAWKAR